MGLLIVFFVLSIVSSFLCSIWEAVLLSITPSYTNLKIQEKSSIGETLKVFKEDIDRPLSAILTLNTIAHTVGAIGVGAQAANVFKDTHTLSLFGLQISWESIIATLMTLAILILSEIIPKTIGANNWKALAPFSVKSISVLMIILKPFIWLSQLITKNLKNEKNKAILSRADFLAMTSVGLDAGTIDQKESKVIKNILTLGKLKVEDVMTPRIVMNIAHEDMTIQEYYDKNQPLRFSRIPLYTGERADAITGIALKDDMLKEIIENRGVNKLSSIKRKVKYVHEDEALTSLFHEQTGERNQLTIVVDKYGSVTGLVTVEDLLETILGFEIVDEMDAVADLREHAQRKWKEQVATIQGKENKAE